MEKEELVSKVNDELGSTKLTISDRTFNEEIEDVLGDFGDNEDVNNGIITRLVKRLKRIDGNLHADVGAENRKYREQFEKDWNEKHNKNAVTEERDDDEPAYFKAYREKMEAKFESLEREYNEEKAKMQKESAMRRVRDGVDAMFSKAGVTPNAYILKQTMRDIDMKDGDDTEAVVKAVEKAYYKNLKEAGIQEDEKPRGGSVGGSKSIATSMWAKKKAREGFGKKS